MVPSPHSVTNDVLLEKIEGLKVQITINDNLSDRRFSDVFRKLEKIDNELGENYVTQKELMPIKVIVYGFAASILLAFLYVLIFKVGWEHP